MMEDEWFAQRSDPSADLQDAPETITVIGKPMPDGVDPAQGHVYIQRLPDQIGDVGMTHV